MRYETTARQKGENGTEKDRFRNRSRSKFMNSFHADRARRIYQFAVAHTQTVVQRENQPTQMADNEPTNRSRYEIDFEHLGILGSGGFAVVFEARNRVDDKIYAIKRQPYEYTFKHSGDGPDEIRKLMEAKYMAKLDHPHVIRYHYAWVEDTLIGLQCERDEVLLSGDNRSSIRDAFTKQWSCSSSVPERGRRLQETNASGDAVLPANGKEKPARHNPSTIDAHLAHAAGDLSIQDEVDRFDDVQHAGQHVPEGTCTLLYIIMDRCKETLLDWLKRDNDRIAKLLQSASSDALMLDRAAIALGILEQITSGLAHIHKTGLVHGDLKPSNILLFAQTENQTDANIPHVVISDFGTARECFSNSQGDKSGQLNHNNKANEPKSTSTNGDHNHNNKSESDNRTSERQRECDTVGQKQDVRSLGVIYLELLLPLTGEDRTHVLVQADRQQFPSVLKQTDLALLKRLYVETIADVPTAAELRDSEPLLTAIRSKSACPCAASARLQAHSTPLADVDAPTDEAGS